MSVNGKVIPHTPLAVDFWQVRKCPSTRLFFLSHMHSDHTVGLSSTWSGRPIYCSPISARLLTLKLQVKQQWIHPLEIGEPILLPLDDIGKEKLTVTLIDANHCPGAVMFLFEGYFGSILYTADFRYTPRMLREPCLRTNNTIDVMYLDNTNCDPNRTLPSRKQARLQIKEIIRSHPNHNIVIGLYTLGKETLLIELAREFKTWIEVSYERMETLKVLEVPDVFTTEPGAGRIRVVAQTSINLSTMHQWNKEYPTLAIVPTSRPLVSCHPNVYVVPYSDHSSFQELEDFVSALKPSSLLPIVGRCISGSLSSLLPSKKRREILVPESVRQYMMRQPEIQSRSAAYSQLLSRHVRPVAPQGVIFESPEQASKVPCEDVCELEYPEEVVSDEQMDTEGSEMDCVLIDISKNLSPNGDGEGDEDAWSLDVVQTMSDDTMMKESLPIRQLTQSNFAQVSILTHASARLNVGRARKSLFETNAKINKRTPSSRNGKSPQRGYGSNHKLPEDDDMSQHIGCGSDGGSSLKISPFSPSNFLCKSCQSSTARKDKNLEELENSILKNLPFTEEDLKTRGLRQHISLQSFLFPAK